MNLFRNRNELKEIAPTDIAQRTTAFGQSSAQSAARRMTLGAASFFHVVGSNWARYQKTVGIESRGKIEPERKMGGMTVPMAICGPHGHPY
jgi:hypothetical protein